MKEYKSKLPEITLKYKTGEQKKVKISTSHDCYAVMKEFYDQDTIELTETFIALFLNRSNNTIGWFKVSQGGIAGTVVDIKLIMATALKCGASGVILSHNHPSGNLNPSEADKRLTTKCAEAGKILDVVVLDHLIVTNQGYKSFADEGML